MKIEVQLDLRFLDVRADTRDFFFVCFLGELMTPQIYFLYFLTFKLRPVKVQTEALCKQMYTNTPDK